MATKVYPRLERRKLKKITEGKRPYSNLEDKAVYVAQFERGMYNEHGSIGLTLDGNGYMKQTKAEPRGVFNGDDDDDEDWNAPILVADTYVPVKKKINPAPSEFPDINFNMSDMIKLREAYFKGTLEKTFATMVEIKMNQGGNA